MLLSHLCTLPFLHIHLSSIVFTSTLVPVIPQPVAYGIIKNHPFANPDKQTTLPAANSQLKLVEDRSLASAP